MGAIALHQRRCPLALRLDRLPGGADDPGDEGGEVAVAYRSRERAEQECARRNAEARAEWERDLDELYPFDMEDRLLPGQDPFSPPAQPPARGEDEEDGKFGVAEVPFFEVVEFELEEAG